jgi:site-specific DNA-methyltransferase (adenine-specific)
MIEIIQGDNLPLIKKMDDEKFQLIYIDPPFNTGKTQKGHNGSFQDSFDNFCKWLKPYFEESRRLLTPNGSFFVHMDYREIHYVKVLADSVFGRENFVNEIIWHYDYGGRSKSRWSAKHDNILWYTKNRKDYVYNYDSIDRIPYMAPGLVGPEKAARGKTPTDVWWNTIVPTQGKERLGYPTQKPLAIIERIVKVHSEEGSHLLDFFAGTGTLGEAAVKHGRNATLIDNNPEAIAVMKKRFEKYGPIQVQTSAT